MTVQSVIETKLTEALSPLHLEVINESGNHSVPAGSESHFKVVLVAAEFEGQRLIARHRRVNGVLADELANSIHALALHTYTEAEWRERFGAAPMSPPCLGGSHAG
ncbi:MAG TPA: BolA/IbaG family iron-sulfur metabolism protein [Pseudomonadales bacterium]|jgi:BolA protein|nr:BolA/IbaG family iron-sulfur metabolism protein [Pseudomonadales bacterium]